MALIDILEPILGTPANDAQALIFYMVFASVGLMLVFFVLNLFTLTASIFTGGRR